MTHDNALDAVVGMVEAYGWMAVGSKLRRYIAQQEADSRALKYWHDAALRMQSERDRLRRELESCKAELELAWSDENDPLKAERDELRTKLEAAEAELPHLREAAELLRAEGTTTSDPQRHRGWLTRDRPSTAVKSQTQEPK